MSLPLYIKLADAQKGAERIAKRLRGGEILGLVGGLGSGKTTFTRHLVAALRSKHKVTSPTFVLMKQYSGRLLTSPPRPIAIYHLDLYRTRSFAEIETLGITQTWGKQETITVIEWADRISDKLPKYSQIIHLTR